ncbi:hypothetical protein [Aureitalea marina]|uniref:Cell envelope biogenesis protein LolA n=1 Tax=Aureitalea marina TaxID=930804 RepID=A0A2S7KNI8_9FLAO|nr:hypothetical protein [Aureitalea marina]PQB04196.1 hypothetical protein BST85_04220 [Aureitalea marina]
MRWILYIAILTITTAAVGQSTDSLVMSLQQRLDTIQSYSARVQLSEEIDFIDMPDKEAVIHYEKDQPILIQSEDFVLLPKRGLDFSLSELFRYPYLVVDRGWETKAGIKLKALNIIPEDRKADFSIATLLIDPERLQLKELEINTKKEGSFYVTMDYNSPHDLMPSAAVVSFTLEKLRIPLNFMGKDSSIDRKALRSEEPKEGRIVMKISDYRINKQ